MSWNPERKSDFVFSCLFLTCSIPASNNSAFQGLMNWSTIIIEKVSTTPVNWRNRARMARFHHLWASLKHTKTSFTKPSNQVILDNYVQLVCISATVDASHRMFEKRNCEMYVRTNNRAQAEPILADKLFCDIRCLGPGEEISSGCHNCIIGHRRHCVSLCLSR